ncbi:MAG: hypothetical protein ABIT01_14445 [Thermoanaerobaculia bacterium]
MVSTAALLVAMLLGSVPGKPTTPPAASDTRATGWPDLPRSGFVSARSAIKQDVDKGSAVFVMKGDKGPIGAPMKIAVPQYAFYLDSETGARTPGIIIQAEEYRELKLIGFRSVPEGKLLGGTLKEFRLLGTARPRASLLAPPAAPRRATPQHP